MTHRSGFVNIIGNPNVGKSTLMNALVGERMSIITSKPQTTRHRIIGILSADNFQIVFSDTPGFIKDPSYKMQRNMNKFVAETFEDADVMLFVTDIYEPLPDQHPLTTLLTQLQVPIILVVNKIDITPAEKISELIQIWQQNVSFTYVAPISALHKTNTDQLLEHIQALLPEGPAYYPKDQLTDRPERFFVSEIIREKILLLYKQEIPYSCEVVVESFKTDETKDLIRIAATIYVARNTHKPIIIGHKGEAIKQLGIEARKDIETFVEKQVYLELHVKVRENWRDNDLLLKNFGY
jgi:GTP-binding protein Era